MQATEVEWYGAIWFHYMRFSTLIANALGIQVPKELVVIGSKLTNLLVFYVS